MYKPHLALHHNAVRTNLQQHNERHGMFFYQEFPRTWISNSSSQTEILVDDSVRFDISQETPGMLTGWLDDDKTKPIWIPCGPVLLREIKPEGYGQRAKRGQQSSPKDFTSPSKRIKLSALPSESVGPDAAREQAKTNLTVNEGSTDRIESMASIAGRKLINGLAAEIHDPALGDPVADYLIYFIYLSAQPSDCIKKIHRFRRLFGKELSFRDSNSWRQFLITAGQLYPLPYRTTMIADPSTINPAKVNLKMTLDDIRRGGRLQIQLDYISERSPSPGVIPGKVILVPGFRSVGFRPQGRKCQSYISSSSPGTRVWVKTIQ